MNELQNTPPGTTPVKKKKLNPKQKLTIELWLSPKSPTFGNLYKSCLTAGFKQSYALNIASSKPLWLSENVDQTILDPEHLKQGVQKLATGSIDSKSVDDTRLKAYELLGKWAGLDQGQVTKVTIVQPILGGQSYQASNQQANPDLSTPHSNVIDIDP